MVESSLTLGYWAIRAADRGNVNRYILAYKNVNYTAKNYTFDNADEWKVQDKAGLGLDFPNLPYIIDGDFKLTESAAVTTYICDKFAPELMGTTPEQRAQVTMLQCVLKDHFMSFMPLAFQGKPQEEVAAKNLEGWPKIAAALGDKNFLVGDSVTMVDFFLWELLETTMAMCKDKRIYTAHPKLEAFNGRMKALPTFAAFLASDKFIKNAFFPPMVALDMVVQE